MSSSEEFSMPNIHQLKPISDVVDHVESGEVKVEIDQKPKPQFSTPEANNQDEIKPEPEGNSGTTKQKKVSEKTPKKPRATMSNGKRIVKRIFFIGATLITCSGLYVLAQQSGYISMLASAFQTKVELSEMDLNQNDQIAKLQLRIGDLSGEISSMQSTFMNFETQTKIDKQAQNDRLEELRTKLVTDTSAMSSQIDDLRASLVSSNLQINALNVLTSNNEKATSSAHAKSESNLKLIDRLQHTVNTLNKDLGNRINDIKVKANASPKPVAKTETPISPRANTTELTPLGKKVVYSYAGLKFQSSFDWSSEKVAIVSDGASASFQLTVGQRLGDAEVVHIDSESLDIKLFDGTVLSLTKG